jgi:hypothetical protein
MIIAFTFFMKTLYFIIAGLISFAFISNLTAQNVYNTNSNGNANNPINYNVNVAVNTDNSSEVQAEVQVEQIQNQQVQVQQNYNPDVPDQVPVQQQVVRVKRNPYKVTPGVYTGMSSGKNKKKHKKRKKSNFFKKLFSDSSFNRINPYKNCSHTKTCFLFS